MRKYQTTSSELRLSPLGELMKQRRISALHLAEETGLHRETIMKHRYGLTTWTAQTLITLADYFDVSTDYLLGRTNVPHYFHNTEVFTRRK